VQRLFRFFSGGSSIRFSPRPKTLCQKLFLHSREAVTQSDRPKAGQKVAVTLQPPASPDLARKSYQNLFAE
jgi:hypothetical protein